MKIRLNKIKNKWKITVSAAVIAMIIFLTQVTFIANSVSGHRNVVKRKNRKVKIEASFSVLIYIMII